MFSQKNEHDFQYALNKILESTSIKLTSLKNDPTFKKNIMMEIIGLEFLRDQWQPLADAPIKEFDTLLSEKIHSSKQTKSPLSNLHIFSVSYMVENFWNYTHKDLYIKEMEYKGEAKKIRDALEDLMVDYQLYKKINHYLHHPPCLPRKQK
jgi:hypothetical protein